MPGQNGKQLSSSQLATRGFATGMMLQAAVGPVFFLILGYALGASRSAAYAGTAAAVFVDALYVLLAVAGVGKLMESPAIRTSMGLVGNLVMIGFGVWMAVSALDVLMDSGMLGNAGVGVATGEMGADSGISPTTAFSTVFIITLSNPLTILFWSGMFASRLSDIETGRRGMLIFAIAAVAATAVFLGLISTIAGFLGPWIHPRLVAILNLAVAAILTASGLVAGARILINRTSNGSHRESGK